MVGGRALAPPAAPPAARPARRRPGCRPARCWERLGCLPAPPAPRWPASQPRRPRFPPPAHARRQARGRQREDRRLPGLERAPGGAAGSGRQAQRPGWVLHHRRRGSGCSRAPRARSPARQAATRPLEHAANVACCCHCRHRRCKQAPAWRRTWSPSAPPSARTSAPRLCRCRRAALLLCASCLSRRLHRRAAGPGAPRAAGTATESPAGGVHNNRRAAVQPASAAAGEQCDCHAGRRLRPHHRHPPAGPQEPRRARQPHGRQRQVRRRRAGSGAATGAAALPPPPARLGGERWARPAACCAAHALQALAPAPSPTAGHRRRAALRRCPCRLPAGTTPSTSPAGRSAGCSCPTSSRASGARWVGVHGRLAGLWPSAGGHRMPQAPRDGLSKRCAAQRTRLLQCRVGGVDFVVGANEGDARDWPGAPPGSRGLQQPVLSCTHGLAVPARPPPHHSPRCLHARRHAFNHRACAPLLPSLLPPQALRRRATSTLPSWTPPPSPTPPLWRTRRPWAASPSWVRRHAAAGRLRPASAALWPATAQPRCPAGGSGDPRACGRPGTPDGRLAVQSPPPLPPALPIPPTGDLNQLNDPDGDGRMERILSYGARSFSIWRCGADRASRGRQTGPGWAGTCAACRVLGAGACFSARRWRAPEALPPGRPALALAFSGATAPPAAASPACAMHAGWTAAGAPSEPA